MLQQVEVYCSTYTVVILISTFSSEKQCILSTSICTIRAWYHTAVMHIMREGDIICTAKMAENRTCDLWSEVHRINGRNEFLPSSVDGVVGDDAIVKLFF